MSAFSFWGLTPAILDHRRCAVCLLALLVSVVLLAAGLSSRQQSGRSSNNRSRGDLQLQVCLLLFPLLTGHGPLAGDGGAQADAMLFDFAPLESMAVFWFSSRTASNPLLSLSNNFSCYLLIFQDPAPTHKNPFGRRGSVGVLAKLRHSIQLESWASSMLFVLDPWKKVQLPPAQTKYFCRLWSCDASHPVAYLMDRSLCWKVHESSGCTLYSLTDVLQDEDVVLVLFGIGQRWTTMPPSLILRFNSEDWKSVSSVMPPQNLQLDSPEALVQTPDSSPEEPPAERRLVCNTLEAFEDWRCSIFEFELSSDERWLFGSIFDLERLCL